MIEIEAPRIKNRKCNVCLSKNDVLELRFWNGNQGIEVAICKTCRKKLAEVLKEGADGKVQT